MVVTWKNKFNRKYGFERDEPHSLSEISKITGYKLAGLQTIFDKGLGAYYNNPQSVRPNVKSPIHWSYSRVYSSVMGGKAARIDASHLIKK